MVQGITTAAQYAQLGQKSENTEPPDFSKVKLGYITMVINQIKTQLILVEQHQLY